MAAKLKQSASTARTKKTSGLEGSGVQARDPAPQMQREPKPPFPQQKQSGVGLESRLDPKPRYQASRYKAAASSKANAR